MASERVNGTELYYEIQGTGDPLVLVHGSWGDSTGWVFVAPMLAENFTVVSYDRRGHGRSAPDEGSRADDEDDLAALIDALNLAPANVAGNSFGASITLGSASRHPEMFRRIMGHEPPLLGLLGEPATEDVHREQRENLARVRKHLEAGEAATGAELFVEEVGLGRGAWAQLPEPIQQLFLQNASTFIGEMRDPDWDTIDFDALAAFTGRVRVTQGTTSLPWFGHVVDQLARGVRSIERETIVDAGHVPQMTHPEALNQTLRAFFTD